MSTNVLAVARSIKLVGRSPVFSFVAFAFIAYDFSFYLPITVHQASGVQSYFGVVPSSTASAEGECFAFWGPGYVKLQWGDFRNAIPATQEVVFLKTGVS